MKSTTPLTARELTSLFHWEITARMLNGTWPAESGVTLLYDHLPVALARIDPAHYPRQYRGAFRTWLHLIGILCKDLRARRRQQEQANRPPKAPKAPVQNPRYGNAERWQSVVARHCADHFIEPRHDPHDCRTMEGAARALIEHYGHRRAALLAAVLGCTPSVASVYLSEWRRKMRNQEHATRALAEIDEAHILALVDEHARIMGAEPEPVGMRGPWRP